MTYRPIAEFRAHDGAALAADLAGGRLVTGGSDRRVGLFSLDGALVASDDEHGDIVKSVRIGPGGRVVSGDRARSVRVWEPGGASGEIGRHDRWVMGVAWSPDGRSVASVSEDATLRVWDAAGGGEAARAALRRPGNAVDWSPDGSRIAVAGGDRALHLFASDGRPERAVPGASQMLWGVRFSPDGARVAWVGRDRVVRVTPAAGGPTLEVGRHAAQVWSVAWDAAGERLVTASADRTARVWRLGAGALEAIPAPAWLRFAGWVGDRLVLAGEDGAVRVLEDDGEPAPAPEPPTEPRAFPVCPHIAPAVTETEKGRCEECGSTEELRLCLTCGHVGCCESQLAHGTKHWEETGHPATAPTPARPLAWRWCYACDDYVRRAA